MPRATEAPTTPAVAPLQHQALPSVADLGRCSLALWTQHNALDQQTIDASTQPARAQGGWGMMLVQQQAEAVEELMLSRTIASVEDALALAVLGFYKADALSDASAAEEAKLSPAIGDLALAFARVAFVIAHTSGVSLSEFARPDTIRRLYQHAAPAGVTL